MNASMYLFVINVAKFAMLDMMPLTIAQANLLPVASAGCLMMGPIPFARPIDQPKKMIAAHGTKYALTVKRWRI